METEIFNIKPYSTAEIILERLAPSLEYRLWCREWYEDDEDSTSIEFSGEILLQIYQAIGKYIETHKI